MFNEAKDTIIGNPVILVVDINDSSFQDFIIPEDAGIPIMDGLKESVMNAVEVVKAGRGAGIPIVVIHEVHRKNGIDFGRELDGSESEHCIEEEGHPDLPRVNLELTDEDYFIFKRRYSAFFGTDLEILLKGLKADTLILVGMLTDVCVHFTFVDGHQSDYYCRVVSDAVCGSSREAHEASLNSMEYLQAGSVMDTEGIIEKINAYGREKIKA
jgi:nicotinamidase-related amidase